MYIPNIILEKKDSLMNGPKYGQVLNLIGIFFLSNTN
mgnify:CR=1 FL=1